MLQYCLHTTEAGIPKAVLDTLSENTILPQTLYIFQDGLKASINIEEWEAVSNVVRSVSWCDTKVIISDKNKGLAKSIKTGVDDVFQSYDAVIVLEDDCVPHPQFMEYMVKALEKYEKNKEVYHIGACSEPVSVERNGTDAYFLGQLIHGDGEHGRTDGSNLVMIILCWEKSKQVQNCRNGLNYGEKI